MVADYWEDETGMTLNDYYYNDEQIDLEEQMRQRPVPIWLCVLLVISYIIFGAFLFSGWERWNFLDSAYFCFISLSTIGFGDFIPAQRVQNEKAEVLLETKRTLTRKK